jgi:hypothetical protein
MIRIDCQGISPESFVKSEQFQTARQCFFEQGYAILDRVVPEEIIHGLHEEFNDRYVDYLRDQEAADSVEVSPHRFMVPLRFSGRFGNPLVFANPYVLALVREILEQDAILEAYGAVVSLSGAAEQSEHDDAPPLFTTELSALLPAYALTFALPLIEMNDLHGTTAIWPGSHRWQARNESIPRKAPTIPIGSCLLWDFRLQHSGTENRSDRPRPMVYATFARRWYRDPVNFTKESQRRLVFDRDFLQSIPEDTRSLLSHVYLQN